MPNSYHYFESGEVSHERLLLEIEILKQLQEADLLRNVNWKSYDTSALQLFLEAGISEVKDELIQRHGKHSIEFEQSNFIQQCIEKHQQSFELNDSFKQPQISFIFILNIIFIFLSLFFVIGLFIYEYILYNRQHHFLQSLEHPLTSKRRHLSFTDDLPVLLLTFTTGIILGCTIAAIRFNRKIILFGIVALIIVIVLLIYKSHQIIVFLSKYREVRWPTLYDYIYS